jgi:hypothetical protein
MRPEEVNSVERTALEMVSLPFSIKLDDTEKQKS